MLFQSDCSIRRMTLLHLCPCRCTAASPDTSGRVQSDGGVSCRWEELIRSDWLQLEPTAVRPGPDATGCQQRECESPVALQQDTAT